MAEDNDDTPAGGDGGTAPDATDGAEGAPPPLAVAAQYIKDLSFEAPMTPGIFGMLRQQEPDITINIGVNAQPMQDDLFEVTLQINAECKLGETVAFLLEVVYGGVFNVNVDRDSLQPILLIECPRLLFPFVRYTIADITRDGGFPPLMMGPVDFVAMYQEQLQRRAAEGDSTDEAS